MQTVTEYGMKAALIDGDSLVYRCGFAVEKTYYLVSMDGFDKPFIFDNAKDAKKCAEPGNYPIWSRKEIEPLDHCLATVKNSLNKILGIIATQKFELYLAGKENFREKITDTYKANRAVLQKPKYYNEIREYLIKYAGGVIVNGYETDDALGIRQMELGKDGIIVAQDKDLDQIPGDHYKWTTGELYSVTPEGGMRFFYEQVLSGDTTDNVKGIPGIGAAKAKAVIEGAKTPKQLAEAVYEAYKNAFGHTADSEVELNASLIWIWRKLNDKHPLWRHMGKVGI